VKISVNISVSKVWNIGIGGQQNIGNLPNICEKNWKYRYRFQKKDIGRSSIYTMNKIYRFGMFVTYLTVNLVKLKQVFDNTIIR